jgi:hypothetical protein
MTANLQNPIFTDETKAGERLEARFGRMAGLPVHRGSYAVT